MPMGTDTASSEAATTTIRYETAAMAELRQLLGAEGLADDDIDTFMTCLRSLERQGFSLTWPGG